MHYTIAIGADHRGYEIKKYIIEHAKLGNDTITWIDEGTYSSERTDYPIYAEKVVHAMKSGKADRGVLLCGSGVGIAIAANRHEGVYAGVVWNEETARLAKEDDNVNVLVLPANFIDDQQAVELIERWLSAIFKGGRYQERISMIDALGK